MFWPVVLIIAVAVGNTIVVGDTSQPAGFTTREACAARLAEMVGEVQGLQLPLPPPIELRAGCIDQNPETVFRKKDKPVGWGI